MKRFLSLTHLSVRDEGEVMVAVVRTPMISDEDVINEFGADLSTLAESDVERLLISFENVTFLSSAAFGKLITFHKKAAVNGLVYRHARFCAKVFDDLHLTRLYKMFKVNGPNESVDQVLEVVRTALPEPPVAS